MNGSICTFDVSQILRINTFYYYVCMHLKFGFAVCNLLKIFGGGVKTCFYGIFLKALESRLPINL